MLRKLLSKDNLLGQDGPVSTWRCCWCPCPKEHHIDHRACKCHHARCGGCTVTETAANGTQDSYTYRAPDRPKPTQ